MYISAAVADRSDRIFTYLLHVRNMSEILAEAILFPWLPRLSVTLAFLCLENVNLFLFITFHVTWAFDVNNNIVL